MSSTGPSCAFDGCVVPSSSCIPCVLAASVSLRPSLDHIVVSSEFQVCTRDAFTNGEQRFTLLLPRLARAIHAKRNAGSRCECLVTIGLRGADSNRRRTTSATLHRTDGCQLEMTITPPHASSSDGAIRPVAAWNRRLHPVLASARPASHSARPFPGNREYGLDGSS